MSNKINTYWICKSDGVTGTHLNNDEYFLWGHKHKNGDLVTLLIFISEEGLNSIFASFTLL